MLERILDASDFAAYTFDKDRKVIYANKTAQEWMQIDGAGSPVGAAQKGHFQENKYFDEQGRPMREGSGETVVDRALRGIETHDLLLEHRNIKKHAHQWLQVSCVPVLENGQFSYGIIWYREVSKKKMRDDRLRFIVESIKTLSFASDLEERMREKAKLMVPSLADWCAIDIAEKDGSVRRVALEHRNPAQVHWIEEYNRQFLIPAGEQPSARAIQTGEPIFVPRVDLKNASEYGSFTSAQQFAIEKLQLTSSIVLPIGVKGHVLGALLVAHAESGRIFSDEDFRFFKDYSQHLGILLENARLYNEIRERDENKTSFLAALSHELRNPLAPIKSSLELLRLENTDDTLTPEIDVIEHQFDHMTKLLNDLLDTTRFTRGKIKMNFETSSLAAVVRHVVSAAEPLAREKGITLTAQYDDDLMLAIDRTRMEQAVSNIVGNALKFTPRGGSISVAVFQKGNDAVVQVQDSGEGLTEEDKKHIFEPYFQGSHGKGAGGLGMGLSLVHAIVQLHGGNVIAESEAPGEGSIFTIRLPLVSHAGERAPIAATIPV